MAYRRFGFSKAGLLNVWNGAASGLSALSLQAWKAGKGCTSKNIK